MWYSSRRGTLNRTFQAFLFLPHRMGTSRKRAGSLEDFFRIDQEWYAIYHLYRARIDSLNSRYVVEAARAAKQADHKQRLVYLSVGLCLLKHQFMDRMYLILSAECRGQSYFVFFVYEVCGRMTFHSWLNNPHFTLGVKVKPKNV